LHTPCSYLLIPTTSSIPPTPISTLFPYTTLFRSITGASARSARAMESLCFCPSEKRCPCSLTWVSMPSSSFSTNSQAQEAFNARSEEHTSELQSRFDLVCRLLLDKKDDDK